MNSKAPKLRFGIIHRLDGTKLEVPLPRFHAGRESIPTIQGTFRRGKGNVYRWVCDHNVTLTIK